jgi:hypothetical protein
MSARSFLILEELSQKHDAKADANQALAAGHGSGTGSTSDLPRASNSSEHTSVGNTSSAGNNKHTHFPKNNSGRGRGHGRGNGGGGNQRPQAPAANQMLMAYNPWTGFFAGMACTISCTWCRRLGPAPTVPATAGHDGLPGNALGGWDPLHQALSTIGVPTQPPRAADWYLDTGATTHMASLKVPSLVLAN